jgi:hypothetical protein
MPLVSTSAVLIGVDIFGFLSKPLTQIAAIPPSFSCIVQGQRE